MLHGSGTAAAPPAKRHGAARAAVERGEARFEIRREISSS